MMIPRKALITVFAVSVSRALCNGNVEEIEKVFRAMPGLYEAWSDDYTCKFMYLLHGVEIFGISTALSLRATPDCWRVEDPPDEVQSCRADVVLQWVRALVGPGKDEAFFSSIPFTLEWKVVPRPELVTFNQSFIDREVLNKVRFHRPVEFTKTGNENHLGVHIVACVRERLMHLFLVLGANLAGK